MCKGREAAKAQGIANWLGDFSEHKTHGRPIGYDVAKSKGLIVKRLEDDPPLQEAVLSVFHSTMVTFQETPCMKIIENQFGNGYFLIMNVFISGAPQAAAAPG